MSFIFIDCHAIIKIIIPWFKYANKSWKNGGHFLFLAAILDLKGDYNSFILQIIFRAIFVSTLMPAIQS